MPQYPCLQEKSNDGLTLPTACRIEASAGTVTVTLDLASCTSNGVLLKPLSVAEGSSVAVKRSTCTTPDSKCLAECVSTALTYRRST